MQEVEEAGEVLVGGRGAGLGWWRVEVGEGF